MQACLFAPVTLCIDRTDIKLNQIRTAQAQARQFSRAHIRCPLAHVRLSAGERRRWTTRFVRRPRGSRPGGGKSSDKTDPDKSDD